MTHIGVLIAYFRKMNRMTKEALADGVCSSKYIYLIEKGERTPSLEIVRALELKLNVQFEDFIPYANCKNIYEVKMYMDKFWMLRTRTNYIELEKTLAQASELSDFRDTFWHIEIEYNQIWLLLMKEQESLKAEFLILKLLDRLKVDLMKPNLDKYWNSDITYRLLNALAVSKAISCGPSEANKIYGQFFDELSKRKNLNAFKELFISATVNYIKCLQLEERHQEANELLGTLTGFQYGQKLLDRLHLTHFLSAVSLYETGDIINARLSFEKAVCSALSNERVEELRILLQQSHVAREIYAEISNHTLDQLLKNHCDIF